MYDKIKVSYERTMEHCRMSLGLASYERSFEEEMLKQSVPGVLPVRVDYDKDQTVFTYDITNRVPLKRVMQENDISVMAVKSLVTSMILQMKEAKQYLLESDNFILEADYIFVSEDDEKVWLCYCGGYEKPVKEQLEDLFEFFMKVIDYRKREVVQLVYALYQLSKKEDCTYDQILSLLNEYEQKEVEMQPNGEEMYETLTKGLAPTDVEEPFKDYEQPLDQKKSKKSLSRSRYIKIAASCITGIGFILFACQTRLIQNTEHEIDIVKLTCTVLIVGLADWLLLRYITVMPAEMVNAKEQKKQGKALQQNRKETYDRSGHTNDSIPHVVDAQVEYSVDEEEGTRLLYEEGTRLLCMPKRLLLTPQDTRDTAFLVETEDALIGSTASEAAFKIAYDTISRKHARITYHEEKFYIEDLNSKNGTFLNGFRLLCGDIRRIENGDLIRFASQCYEASEV